MTIRLGSLLSANDIFTLIDSLGEDSDEQVIRMQYNKKTSIRNSIRKNKLHKKSRNFRSSEFNNTERRRCSYPTNPNSYEKNIPNRHSVVSSSLSENHDHDADFLSLAAAIEKYPDSNGPVLISNEKETGICNGIANMQSELEHESVLKQCSLPTTCMNNVIIKDNINRISGKDKYCRHKQTIIFASLHICNFKFL